MNPIPPTYNLYEELPEPIFQEMKDTEDENKQVNDYFTQMAITNLTDFDTI